ncbi:hypothetical protein W909_11550 [Dickeya zeae EC1]|nr:hypothetical protein W909_11550 [Dickeya zeae EC1]
MAEKRAVFCWDDRKGITPTPKACLKAGRIVAIAASLL